MISTLLARGYGCDKVGHMTSMINIAAGFVGAILGGWLGYLWALPRYVIDWNPLVPIRYEIINNLDPDLCWRTSTGSRFCEDFYDWGAIVPVTLAAAIVGAMIVLIGFGILRKLYR